MRCVLVPITAVILGIMPAVMGACFSINSANRPPTTYLVLSSLAGTAPATLTDKPEDSIAIGVGPIVLPEYLNRRGVMIRTGTNELQLADFVRWAELPEDNMVRVVSENLSVLLHTNRIYPFPWKQSDRMDYQVRIHVIRFDGTPGGTVTLLSRWTLSDGNNKTVLLSRQSDFSESVDKLNYELMASALSRALEHLSREIASSVRALHEKP